MLLHYVSLVGGLVLLIMAGDILVRGAVGIAQRLGIPHLVIGLTIVAFGTSAPELLISLKAAMAGSPSIAIGNVVGSNIANVLMVLGVPALIAATSCGEEGATRNALFMVAVSIIFIIMAFMGTLGHVSGAILLLLLLVFLGDSVRATRKHRSSQREVAEDVIHETDDVTDVPASTWLCLLYLVIGLVGLPFGAEFTIDGATAIARAWGVTEAVIGLTVIALGTSLPELATSVMAAVRRQGAVAIGNVIGSNIFNLLAILGITAVIAPMKVPPEFLKLDVWVMLACALLVMLFAMRKTTLRFGAGLALVILYCAYIFVVYELGKIA